MLEIESNKDEEEAPKKNVLAIVINEASLTLVIVECYRCGIVFAFPRKLQANLKENQNSFYCPNGHSQYYPAERREGK